MEGFRKRNISARDVGVLHSQKGMGKREKCGCRSRKTRRNTRSVATRTSFSKRFLEQVKRNADTDCNAPNMRLAYNAKMSGIWESFKEEFRKEGKLCEWNFMRLQEACDKVASEDIGHLSIAQGNFEEEHGL